MLDSAKTGDWKEVEKMADKVAELETLVDGFHRDGASQVTSREDDEEEADETKNRCMKRNFARKPDLEVLILQLRDFVLKLDNVADALIPRNVYIFKTQGREGRFMH